MPNSSEPDRAAGGSKNVVAGTVVGIVLAVLAFPFLQNAVRWLGADNYPGTVQQAGMFGMQSVGKRVAVAVFVYHLEHDRWPDTLDEVIAAGHLTPAELRSYPPSDDLPDMRDIRKMKHFEDWIYLKPIEGEVGTPLIVAPRVFTRSMGKALPKPLRIVVKTDTIPEWVEDSKVAPLLRARVEGGGH